jgi:hypothetical protein
MDKAQVREPSALGYILTKDQYGYKKHLADNGKMLDGPGLL